MYFSRTFQIYRPTILCARISPRLREIHCTHHHTLAIYMRYSTTPACLALVSIFTSVSRMLQLIQGNSHTSHRSSLSNYILTSTHVANSFAIGHASSSQSWPSMPACMLARTCDVSNIAAARRARHQQRVLVTIARTRALSASERLQLFHVSFHCGWSRISPAVVCMATVTLIAASRYVLACV